MIEIEYLSKKVKFFNKSINASILLVIILWISLALLSLFPNKIIIEIESYLFAISIFLLISGLILGAVYAFYNNPVLVINDNFEIKLILNIRENDYRINQLGLLKYTGNFLKDPISNTLYELTSDQVKELLAEDRIVPFILEFQKHKSSFLAGISPKAFFKDSMQVVLTFFS